MRSRVVLLLAALAGACSGHTHIDRPSIVLLLVDTLRADYLGSYGFDGPISPNLDRFARQAVLFKHCESQAPWTKPAIASLFTSLDPATHRVSTHAGRYGERPASRPLQTDVLHARFETLAEALQVAGYETAAYLANPWIRRETGFAQGFEWFDQDLAPNFPTGTAIVQAATTWLENRADTRPFFLYLHFMDVHEPYDAPVGDWEAIRNAEALGTDEDLSSNELPQRHLGILQRMHVPWALGPETYLLRGWRGHYAAGVHALDRRIEPLLEFLDDSGLLSHTVVVLTADHGEQLREHGGWGHGDTLYEHELHVPLMIRYPGGRLGGHRIAGVVRTIDLMPTLLALAGARTPALLQGRDLAPLLAPASTDAPLEPSFATAVKWKPTMASVRLGRFKLIHPGDGDDASLFDLDTDPAEQHDLAARRPRLLEVLQRLLQDHTLQVRSVTGPSDTRVTIPPEIAQRLRNLGYLQ